MVSLVMNIGSKKPISMMPLLFQFWVISMLSVYQMSKAQSTMCKDIVSMKGKMSLSSYHNKTGYWIAHVTLHDSGTNDDNFKTKGDVWNIDTAFDRERCNGAELQKIEFVLTIPPLRPGPNYEFHASLGYYKFHPEKKSWHEAKDICASEGAHLAIVNSVSEANLFKEMIKRSNDAGDFASIGFHDLYAEGQYFTLFGEPLQATGYTKWRAGQPNNFGGNETDEGQDCGCIDREGALNDSTCNGKFPFICEHEL